MGLICSKVSFDDYYGMHLVIIPILNFAMGVY